MTSASDVVVISTIERRRETLNTVPVVSSASGIATMLGERVTRHRPDVWLVNTGWTAGPYGQGHRIRIPHTRAMIRALLGGRLNGGEFVEDPIFAQMDAQHDAMVKAMDAERDAYLKESEARREEFRKASEQRRAEFEERVKARRMERTSTPVQVETGA